MKVPVVEPIMLPAFAMLGAAAASWSWWAVGAVALLALWLTHDSPTADLGHRCPSPRCGKCGEPIHRAVDVCCGRCVRG